MSFSRSYTLLSVSSACDVLRFCKLFFGLIARIFFSRCKLKVFVSQLPFHYSRSFEIVKSFAFVELSKPIFDGKELPKALFASVETANVTLCKNWSFWRNRFFFAKLSCSLLPRILSTLRSASFAWCLRKRSLKISAFKRRLLYFVLISVLHQSTDLHSRVTSACSFSFKFPSSLSGLPNFLRVFKITCFRVYV